MLELLKDVIDPSTFLGALSIGILGGLISGYILGFLRGKKITMNKFKTTGSNSPIISNSKIGER